ncbi:MAG: amino acid ABC transporter substrate-binding protein [Desulfobacterales bacterium]|nr:amino acid ABC transporter substrate-binding protein [Desulfobacterales bacterium]
MKIYSVSINKTIFLLILFFYITAFSQEILNVHVTEWPPIYYQDKAGHWTGLDVELFKAIIKKAGLKQIFKNQPWIRGLKELESGSIHVVLNMNRTKERSVYTNWIGPIRKDDIICIIVKKKNRSMPVDSLDDLVKVSKKYNKKFGFQRGVFYSKEFNERIKNDSEFLEHFAVVADTNINFKLTLYNRILGCFESPLRLGHLIKNDPKFKNLSTLPFRFKKGDEVDDIYYGISKKSVNKDTLKKIQEAYSKCKKDGTIKRIIRKWNKKF